MGLKEVAVGQVLPEQSFGPVSMTDIVRYQGASGDLVPLHHDDEFARAAGFPAAFSVGMLSAGWLASVVTDHFGETAVRRIGTRFTGIVHRGDRHASRATRHSIADDVPLHDGRCRRRRVCTFGQEHRREP